MIAINFSHSFIYNKVRINIYHANKGEGLPYHSHAYSHATFCCSGSCVVRNPRGKWVVTKETQPINLIAGELHEIEALENETVFVNVFAEGIQ